MTYTTSDDLSKLFGERMLIDLTDRSDPPAGAIDAAVMGKVLADTDAMIDGYLAGLYVLPMATTPPQVTDLAAAIAIYKLHTFSPDPKIIEDYKLAIQSLKDISRKTIKLDVAGVEPATTGASGARVTDRERPLTAKKMKGFI